MEEQKRNQLQLELYLIGKQNKPAIWIRKPTEV